MVVTGVGVGWGWGVAVQWEQSSIWEDENSL
jgi:hypothetical protein